jgi:hypothetical protein
MNEHGGHRPGAGRPVGTPNRATVDAKARLSELARQHAGTAIEALAQVAESGTTESARIAAACAILDRGYGKPREAAHAQYQRRGAGIFDLDDD